VINFTPRPLRLRNKSKPKSCSFFFQFRTKSLNYSFGPTSRERLEDLRTYYLHTPHRFSSSITHIISSLYRHRHHAPRCINERFDAICQRAINF
jgi:hypothetical protein